MEKEGKKEREIVVVVLFPYFILVYVHLFKIFNKIAVISFFAVGISKIPNTKIDISTAKLNIRLFC